MCRTQWADRADWFDSIDWMLGALSTQLVALVRDFRACVCDAPSSYVEPTELAHAIEMLIFYDWWGSRLQEVGWQLRSFFAIALHELADISGRAVFVLRVHVSCQDAVFELHDRVASSILRTLDRR